MKIQIIDDIPVALEDSYLAQLAEEDEAEALRYSFGLGRRAEEEDALDFDDEE
jgi:hypothetical protein